VFYSLIQSREYGFADYWVEDGILYGSQQMRDIFQSLVGALWARLATAEQIAQAIAAKPKHS
jgi:hypothetical protein